MPGKSQWSLVMGPRSDHRSEGARKTAQCVCVNYLKRCKTSNLGFLFIAFCKFAGGDRVAAWLSPTKLHAVH